MTTPYLRRYYAGGGTATTLQNSMAASDSSFTIVSDTGWPGSPAGATFVVVVDRGVAGSEEKIRCVSNSGTTVTVASDGNGGRGYDGTSATTHNAGATVSLCGAAIDFDEANQVVTQVLGQSGAAKGDLLAMLSAAGPNTLTRVPIGTSPAVLGVSAGLPAWETPANGYGITGFAANPMTPAVSLTTSESFIGSNQLLGNGAATNITSLSLATGTWLVIGRADLHNANGGNTVEYAELWLGPTSASVTGAYTGGAAALMADVASSSAEQTMTLQKILTLGTTTTVYLQGKANNADVSALAATRVASLPNATGITAVRIA